MIDPADPRLGPAILAAVAAAEKAVDDGNRDLFRRAVTVMFEFFERCEDQSAMRNDSRHGGFGSGQVIRGVSVFSNTSKNPPFSAFTLAVGVFLKNNSW
jgi:hypothetical protein